MLCIDSEYSYMGALVRIAMYATSNNICEEIKQSIAKGYEGFINIFRSHGGCVLVSEDPLKIASKDGNIETILEPRNYLAKMFWREAINRFKTYCQS